MLAAYMACLQPGKLPVVLLVVPFLLLFMALYSSWKVGLALCIWYKTGVSQPGQRRLGAVISGGVVILLILQSLGQLTIRDVVTLVAIGTIGYLYIMRSRAAGT